MYLSLHALQHSLLVEDQLLALAACLVLKARCLVENFNFSVASHRLMEQLIVILSSSEEHRPQFVVGAPHAELFLFLADLYVDSFSFGCGFELLG